MSETSVVKHLLNREFYHSHRDSIDLNFVTKELHPVIRTIDGFYKTNDEGELTPDDLSNLFFSSNRTKIEFYQGVLDAVKANSSGVDTTVKLIQGLQRLSRLRELSLLAYDASEGKDTLSKVLALSEGLSTSDETTSDQSEISCVSDDLRTLIDASHAVAGLRFRLNSLNKALGSLRKGDFGFIFARPETGKTTFLASEVTFMAEQATGPILWLNNEEQDEKVMLRCYQAALGITMEQLMIDIEGNKKKFHDLFGGRLKIFNIVSATKSQIEKLIAREKPSLVVFDQIDKIKGFDNDREDLRLGSIYIWARELAKTYCPVIGVCQADGSGEGQRWLSMANVANAKTSKQAEADWILGIGRVNDVGYDNLRFLHLSKNKLLGDPDSDNSMRHGRWETLIDPERARYVDL